MSQPISLCGFARQDNRSFHYPCWTEKIILPLSQNNKSHWHRRLGVSHVKDLEGKERCAANWKITIRNLSALIDSAISCYPVVWLPVWKSNSAMVQAFYLGLLGRSWMKRAVASLLWFFQLHSHHPSAWEPHGSLPKLFSRYACALIIYLPGPDHVSGSRPTWSLWICLPINGFLLDSGYCSSCSGAPCQEDPCLCCAHL